MKLFQIACAVAEHDRYSPTMTLLIDKLSAMKREELSKLRFSQVSTVLKSYTFLICLKYVRFLSFNIFCIVNCLLISSGVLYVYVTNLKSDLDLNVFANFKMLIRIIR